MGQKFGKAPLLPVVEPFCNLSRKYVTHLWQIFNDISDGFGISQDEFEEICSDLVNELNVTRSAMGGKSIALFQVYDTDKNGLIDALEFISSLSVISGMRFYEIVEFVLTSYDFDGTSHLSIDEVSLALKSVSIGLCKLANLSFPSEDLIEQLVSMIFSDYFEKEATDEMKMKINLLSSRLEAHPDIISWFSFFGNPHQYSLQYYDIMASERDYDKEFQLVKKSSLEVVARNWNVKSVKVHNEEESFYPWISSVAMLTPLQYANTLMKESSPDATLKLEWVYGYQSERCRNNARYNCNGSVTYNSGKYVVTYDFNNQKQSIFSGHNEEISCLDIHPGKELIASGDIDSHVIVWNTVTNQILFSNKNMHTNGICHVNFSADGKLLACVGNDGNHLMAVFNWNDNIVLFTTDISKNPCLALTFLGDNTVVVGGESYLYYYSKCTEGYMKRSGNFSRFTKKQPITCLTRVYSSLESVISGTISGELYLWVDRNCMKNVKGHDGCLNALYSTSNAVVISGGVDRRVRVWNEKLEPGASFDMSSFGANASIRSVCITDDGTNVLVGLKCASIFEISAVDGSVLRGGAIASGHYYGTLNCIATHPSKHEIASVGEDKHLCILSMKSHNVVKTAVFDTDITSIAYSPLGDTLVIGLGGLTSKLKCGAFVILNEEDLAVIHEAKDSSSQISVIAFSSEGETLALGCDDGVIFLYAVQDEYELIGRCIRHTFPVLHIDFSVDGEWIRSNSKEKDVCFFNSDDGSYQSNLQSMRDVLWASHTCKYSWHNKSIHRSTFNDEEVGLVTTPTGTGVQFVASTTNFGYIRLHSFPCIPDNSEYHRYPAHSNVISGLTFSFDSEKLISSGLKDRTLLQWRCIKYNVNKEEQKVADLPESDDFLLEAREGSDLEVDFIAKTGTTLDGILNSCDLFEDDDKLPAIPAIDAWLETVVSPNYPPIIRTSPPDLSFQLQYVYGYKCQDMRNNVRYTSQGDIIYPCSTVGVVMKRGSKEQRFFQRHNDSITAFACSNDGAIVATGQMGHESSIYVWDTKSCQTLSTIPDPQMKGVCCMSFSSDNKLLAIVGLDQFHSISVYDWKHSLYISRFYGGSNRLFSISFSGDTEKILACGIKTIKIWKEVRSRVPSLIVVNLGEIGVLQSYLCSIYFNNSPVVGCSDGNLYVFKGSDLHHAIKAHQGSVNSMDVSRDNKNLVTGGRDGAIRIWNTGLEVIKEVMVDSLISSQCPRVRSVAFSLDGNNILAGTRGAEIIEISSKSGTMVGSKPLINGHGCRELWGLAMNPLKEEFLTSGDDATLRLWDAKSFSLLKTLRMDTAARAVAYSANGKFIAIGFGCGKRGKGKAAAKEGAFAIMNVSDLKIVHEGKDSNEPIRVVKFSPDSNYLAVGSDDSCIYIYNVKDQFSRRSIISCHKAPIATIDFNLDGTFIMSTDTSKRLCFSETLTGTQILSPVALRDEKWSTWTSPIGWSTQGLWMCQPEGVEPISAQRSWNGDLVTVGSTNGRIYVTYFPCPKRSGFVGSLGHSGNVSQLGWTYGDKNVISIGTKDYATFQWKCKFDNGNESGDEGGISCEDSDIERLGGNEYKKNDILRKNKNADIIEMPWQTSIMPPSNITVDDIVIPKVNVDIEFAHGIRVADCRQNLKYNENGYAVYIVTTLGVIYNRNDNTQKTYKGHTNPLISLDVNREGSIAATGEMSKKPELHIWDANTTRFIIKFENIHLKGITSLSFSSSSKYLSSLGQDHMNSVVIFYSPSGQWQDGFIHATISCSPQKMFWVLYMEENEYPIVVGGNKIIYFCRCNG